MHRDFKPENVLLDDKFRGIRNDLCNLLGIPIEDVLLCILHGGIRGTGMYIFLSKFN